MWLEPFYYYCWWWYRWRKRTWFSTTSSQFIGIYEEFHIFGFTDNHSAVSRVQSFEKLRFPQTFSYKKYCNSLYCYSLDREEIFVRVLCFPIFSCDEQLKKWLCHSVPPSISPLVISPLVMKEFLAAMSSSRSDVVTHSFHSSIRNQGLFSIPKEFQLCFKGV